MSLGTALVALLNTSTAITAIASGAGAIAVGTVDQGVVTPYIRLSTQGTDPMEDLEGSGGMEMPTVDIDCVATSKPQADSLAAAVKSHIRNYKGTIGGHRIRAVIYEDSGDDVVPAGQGSQRMNYVTTVTFQVQYE